ncbi:acyltransferase [Escherichia coli]|uniref:acyltransferase n=1 Tax=Escherichia coli TaxID=562 RepID=UPI0010D092E2|nr:acyltransferase [Escherichia coli]EID2680154.1 acyltransferase [Escherichia coli]GDR83594.1 O-acetyltransferase for enterobacterial common antigen [Escherichia coli]
MNEKNYGVVLARFIAIVLVVLLHAAAGPVGAKSSPDWDWANVYSAISKQCIGIFIVITGFLYYHKKEFEFYDYIKKGFNVLFVPLVFWWVIYASYYIIFKDTSVSSFNIMKPSAVHLWFMYHYIAIYMFLPMIIIGCQRMDLRYNVMIFLILFYGNSVHPQLKNFIPNAPSIDIPFVSTLMFYVFAGCIVARLESHIIKLRAFISLTAISLAVICVFINKSILIHGFKGVNLSNFSPIVGMTAIATTCACIGYADRIRKNANKLVTLISEYAFGVYLIHPLVVFISWEIVPVSNYAWGIPVATIFYITASTLIAMLLSRMPLLNRVIAQ